MAPLAGKNCFIEMVWYFIGVYIINRTLHGRLEIRNFSSRVENVSLVRCAHSWNIFQHSKRHFVSPRGHVISSISEFQQLSNTPSKNWFFSYYFRRWYCFTWCRKEGQFNKGMYTILPLSFSIWIAVVTSANLWMVTPYIGFWPWI